MSFEALQCPHCGQPKPEPPEDADTTGCLPIVVFAVILIIFGLVMGIAISC